MDASIFLNDALKNLSGKQRNHLIKLERIVSHGIALGLLSMQPTASAKEIDLIAEMLSLFSNLKIYSTRMNPKQVVFEGYHNNFCVRVHPQYIIRKPKDHPHYSDDNNSAKNYWAIDLAIEILIDDLRLALVLIEYDGHASHYLETGVKRSYLRDWGIFSVEGVATLRISPDQWAMHKEYYKSNLLKHFSRVVERIRFHPFREFGKFNKEQERVPDFIVRQQGSSFIAIPLTRKLIEEGELE